MRRTLAILVSLVLTVLSVVFLYPPDCAYACSCMGVSTQRYISSSDALFSGKVLNIEKEAATSRHHGTTRATLRVSEVWKGPERATLVVSTPSQGSACGYHFEEGQEYLVFAYGKGDPFKTDICSGTKSLSKADKDLALLGNGEKPKDGGDEILTDTSGVIGARAMVGIAGLAMVGSFLIAIRLVRTD